MAARPAKSDDAADGARLKKERRNERDRQRSFLKRESLNEMRKLVEELEAAKRRLLAEATTSPRSPSTPAPTPAPPREPLAPSAHAHALASDIENAAAHSPRRGATPRRSAGASLSPSKVERADFVQLTEQLECLRVENAALAQLVRERDLFNSAMQHLLLDFQRRADEPAETAAAALVGFAPLSRADVRAAVAAALQLCRAARDEMRHPRASAGQCFGWTDARARAGATVTFTVHKRLVNARAAALRDSMWDLATDSARLAGLLPPGLTCDLRVLQRVSRDTLVLDRRTYPTGAANGLVLRTVLLAFRMRDADGSEVLVMRTLDAPLVQALLRPHELWCDVFYWMRFAQEGAGSATGSAESGWEEEDEEKSSTSHTLSEFGGVLSYVREDLASAWMAELLFLAVRWETLAVRPVLLTAA
ncbi:hypothetical protein PybrP1_010640 [[Pythium] brassicae (nom. inval.)]|nr:hypothetical protein PybrP1_010640 [[Pythium] brassicae (nom. inval.)]